MGILIGVDSGCPLLKRTLALLLQNSNDPPGVAMSKIATLPEVSHFVGGLLLSGECLIFYSHYILCLPVLYATGGGG